MNERTIIPPVTGIRNGLDPVEDERGGRSFFSMGRGYIRLHRSLTDWEWYHNERLKSVFIHLLVRCNWTDKNWQGMEVKAGTFVTSTGHLAEELHLSRSAVVRALDRLEKSGEILVKADSKRTAITLVNWAKYQDDDDQPGQQTDSKRTANGQQTDPTNKEKQVKKGNTEARSRAHHRSWTVEQFTEACGAAVKNNPDRLAKEQRKPFLDYWTEADGNGKMRFQIEKVFDVGKRMDRWARNNFGNGGNSKPTEMTKAEADEALRRLRIEHGIPPGGMIETHLIPKDVLEAIRRP